MTAEKQIEEMAKTVCHLDRTCDECMTSFECKAMMYAKRFYNAGYRKASEVAEEIMQEVRQALLNMILKNAMGENYDIENRFAEIEKKYTGEK